VARFAKVDIEWWGSTPDERSEQYPCDGLLADPEPALFRAIDVQAPAPVLFRWLCQLRVAPYSYDWIDNYGRRSPRQLTPGLDDLQVGQRVMTIFRLAHVEPGSSISLISDHAFFGRMAVTYRVRPKGPEASRLVVKLLAGRRAGIGRLIAKALPAADLVMMRRQLLNLKALAEAAAPPDS
jgi:hypothetical protein